MGIGTTGTVGNGDKFLSPRNSLVAGKVSKDNAAGLSSYMFVRPSQSGIVSSRLDESS